MAVWRNRPLNNQGLNGVNNHRRRHKGKEKVVAIGNSWVNVSSVEKSDIDLMSVLRKWQGIS